MFCLPVMRSLGVLFEKNAYSSKVLTETFTSCEVPHKQNSSALEGNVQNIQRSSSPKFNFPLEIQVHRQTLVTCGSGIPNRVPCVTGLWRPLWRRSVPPHSLAAEYVEQ
jgi:hypothetical protein